MASPWWSAMMPGISITKKAQAKPAMVEPSRVTGQLCPAQSTATPTTMEPDATQKPRGRPSAATSGRPAIDITSRPTPNAAPCMAANTPEIAN